MDDSGNDSLIKPEKEDRYYHHMDEHGNIHMVDILTGNIVRTAARREDALVIGKQLDPQFVKGKGKHWVYNEIYRDLICELIAGGATFTAITKRPGMPSNATLAKWRAKHPDFEDMIKVARKQRAETYHDNVAEALDGMRELSKDEIPAEKLYVDTNKWLAEKNDPDTFGNKVKHSGDKDAPMTIVLDTGIRETRDNTPSLDEPEDVVDAEYEEI